MRRPSLVRSVILVSVLATGCDSSRETTEPSPEPAVPPELLGTAIRLRVDLAGGSVSVVPPTEGRR